MLRAPFGANKRYQPIGVETGKVIIIEFGDINFDHQNVPTD